MSAKGLPPAVRLDPLLPLALTCTNGHNIAFNAPSQNNSSTCTGHNSSNQLCSPQLQTQPEARGLTPIIITPESSSRPPTPATGGSDRGTPRPASMGIPTTTAHGTTGRPAKRIKFDMKVEPVELDPILPSSAKQQKMAMGVAAMDEDEGIPPLKLPPTPCMTPVLHPVDKTIREERRGGPERSSSPPRTGRTILAGCRPGPAADDVPAASHRQARIPNLSDLADVAERERMGYEHEEVRRGRTKERRKNSRFRDEKARRYRPYDQHQHYEMQSASTLPNSSSIPSRPMSQMSNQASRSPNVAGADHPPPSTPHHSPPAPPSSHHPSSSSSPALPPIGAPHPIPKAADHLIHLFNAELHNQIQGERDAIRFERESIIRERNDIQRERELMQQERAERREGKRSYETYAGTTIEAKDKEIMDLKEENRKLRVRVRELQAALDDTRRGTGRLPPAVTHDTMKPAPP